MRKFNVTVNGVVYEVEVEEVDGVATAPVAAAPVAAPKAAPTVPAAPKAVPAKQGSVAVKAPMPGTILKISVKVGDAVKKGDLICVLEAMKMENEIFAPADGTVASINVAQGASVAGDETVVTLA